MSQTSEPAFPILMIPCDDHGGFTEVRSTGLTIRDYFAAKALQGILSYSACQSESAAKQAFIYADAMMKARNP